MTDPLDGLLSVATVIGRLADRGITVSERALKAKARERGCFRQIGGAMFFSSADLERLMEPQSCPTKKTVSAKPAKARSGSTGSQSAVVGLSEARAKLREARRAQNGQR